MGDYTLNLFTFKQKLKFGMLSKVYRLGLAKNEPKVYFALFPKLQTEFVIRFSKVFTL